MACASPFPGVRMARNTGECKRFLGLEARATIFRFGPDAVIRKD